MSNTVRPYNALTAAELLVVIPAEVKRALEKVIGSSPAITYPLASWSWTLTLLQQDHKTGAAADTPERVITAGEPEVIQEAKDEDIKNFQAQLELAKTDDTIQPGENPGDNLIRSLTGGSKRFPNKPPSPTQVREAEGLPIPER